jgi:vacuolar protein sorting-associated protein 35
MDVESTANISELLVVLINSFPNFLSVLSISSYLPLLALQPESTQRDISSAVLDKVLESERKIETVEEATGVFDLLKVTIRSSSKPADSGGVPGGTSTGLLGVEAPVEPVYNEEQSKLAKIVHRLYNKDPDMHAKLLAVARNALHDGGAMARFTYPAIVTNATKLVRRYKRVGGKDSEAEAKMSSIYKFLHRIISEIAGAGAKPELALRLYVDVAAMADKVKAEEAAYEFLAEAFTLYEEYVTDSRAQFQALCIICGTLQSSRNFSTENYDTLVSKCAQYGSKLLKKPDQCRAVYIASHLWCATEIAALGEEEGSAKLYRDDKRVLECLQRALRVADACMDVAISVELFVEILNRYIYYFDHGNTEVTARHINGLIEVIQTNLANNSDESTSVSPRMHFERTLHYISLQRDTDPRFQEIVW